MRDKPDKAASNFHLSSADNSRDNICQSLYTQPASTPSSSSSTSPSSSSDMNILQEIEGILNASNSTNESKEKDDYNLIDFGGDDDKAVERPRRRRETATCLDPLECAHDSDLLSDVIKELDKSTSMSRQHWTKFD
jgi:hypothetical protein